MAHATDRCNLRSVDRDRSQLAKGRRRRRGSGRDVPAGGPAALADLAIGAIGGGQRDFEYLSGFAATPFHLVNYVAPGLFHRSPMWRPLVWDPFHTSPEEHLAYIGLIPLFLACMTMIRELRRDPTVRLLTLLVFVTLVLSLGPYMPGFRLLIALPGFSFFRAPSRWSLATALALSLLAGKGFDRLREWPRPGRSLWWFSVGRDRLDGRRPGPARAGIVQHVDPAGPSVARAVSACVRCDAVDR